MVHTPPKNEGPPPEDVFDTFLKKSSFNKQYAEYDTFKNSLIYAAPKS